MEMNELFKEQLENNNLVTEETYTKLKQKNYYLGDPINIGDNVLFAMLMGEVKENNDGVDEQPLTLITINERHFNHFKPAERQENYITIPVVKLK